MSKKKILESWRIGGIYWPRQDDFEGYIEPHYDHNPVFDVKNGRVPNFVVKIRFPVSFFANPKIKRMNYLVQYTDNTYEVFTPQEYKQLKKEGNHGL